MSSENARVASASLRHRLALALAGLSALTVTGLGGVYLFAERVIERDALHREMARELRALLDHEIRGEQVVMLSTLLRYFPDGTVPPPLAALAPGMFRRLHFEGRTLQAFADADDAGRVHVLTHDMSFAEQRERSMLVSLIAGALLASAAAWVGRGAPSAADAPTASPPRGPDPRDRSPRAGAQAGRANRRRGPRRGQRPSARAGPRAAARARVRGRRKPRAAHAPRRGPWGNRCAAGAGRRPRHCG